jgi:hypothetical protein
MNTSPTIGSLAKALSAAQSEMQGAIKDSSNPFFKSKYADLASVWEACRAALTKNGIAVVQSPSADGAKVSVTTLLCHESGEWVSGTLTSTAKDESPQSLGSCVTYLRRYGISALVGIAPEDDDGEAAQGRTTYPPAPRLDIPKAPKPPLDDKAAAAKVLRIKALMNLHGDNFKTFAEKVLGRPVKGSGDLSLGDVATLEEGGDVP